MKLKNMTNDLYVIKKCRKCRTLNQFELNNTEHTAFDVNNSEQWALLEEAFKSEITDAKNLYLHGNELFTSYHKVSDEELYSYIAEQLKFDDIAFCKCEHCKKTLMLYIISS